MDAAGTPAEREVRLASHYLSDVLTVWRFLHVEVDSMAAPPTTGAEKNTADGNLTGVVGNRTVAQRVNLNINLKTGFTPQDNSDNLTAGTGNGRFENGWIKIGSGGGAPGQTQTGALLGNGDDYVRRDAGIDIPFKVSKPGRPDVSGKVVAWSGTAFTLGVASGTPSTNYNGGTLNVAGVSATITTASGANIVNVTAAPSIPFVLHDDDDVSLPHSPSFGLMEDKYRPAFILPLADGGTALSNNKDTIAFRRNVDHTSHVALDSEFNKSGAFESESSRTNRYWISYILGAFQAGVVMDYDPDLYSEWGPHGVNGGGTTYNGGALYFHESTRDYCTQHGLTSAQSLELEGRLVVHEIGHQFDLHDNTGGIYDYAVIYNTSQNPTFTDAHLDSIRDREKSPGK